MARASYQHIANIVIGKPKKSTKKKPKTVKTVQSTPYSSPISVPPKPLRPKLTLKF